MSMRIAANHTPGAPLRRRSRIPGAARVALSLMERLAVGTLSVRLPGGEVRRFGHGAPVADMTLANWNVCDKSLSSGDVGFGETYIAGDWDTSDLDTLMDLMVANRGAVDAVIYGTWWGRLAGRLRHQFRRNTRNGARRNVHAHYDIGNDFYALWLDPGMTYSSALYGAPLGEANDVAQLASAQDAKYDRILAQLALAPGARVLEIGSGWGGFAERAARRELQVDGITISDKQLDFARCRVARAGVDDKARFSLRDYRDIEGKFDAVASIEMFEAVGMGYWDGYFECVRRALAPRGRAVIQTITIAEHLFEGYRHGTDFIQQYIFPGGMLPTRKAFRELAQRHGLSITDEFAFGADYARTLGAWQARLRAAEGRVLALGFDAPFVRTFAFYLAYCRAAFRHANTDVVQFTLTPSEAGSG